MSEEVRPKELLDKIVSSQLRARQIIRTINDYGVNNDHIWLLIYYLAMQLEEVELMQELTSFIKEVKGTELFATQAFGGEDGSEHH